MENEVQEQCKHLGPRVVRYHNGSSEISCGLCGQVLYHEPKSYYDLPVVKGKQGFGDPNIRS